MASPEWPKFEFKDGRKRMTTLPIVDTRGNEEGDMTTPRPTRLNSTESALKRAKTEGAKDMTTPKPLKPESTESSINKLNTEGAKDMTTPKSARRESTERSIKKAKIDREKDMTTPKPTRRDSTESSIKRAKTDVGKDSTPRIPSSLRRKSSKAEKGEWMSKESTQKELKSQRSIASIREIPPDTVLDNRSEIHLDTVVEKKSSTVGERRSIEMKWLKKKNETLFKPLENVKSEEKKEKVRLPILPDPLSELMLERDENVRKEMEEAKRRKRENTTGKEAAAVITTPSLSRRKSLLAPSKMRPIQPQRRSSFDTTVFMPNKSIVPRKENTVLDGIMKNTVVRKMSVSPSGGLRDNKRKESGDGKMLRRSTEGCGNSDWISPSLQDFRPSRKQARSSTDGGKEKETTVPLVRKITSVVPATPMASMKEGAQRKVSLNPTHLISPSASDFTPKNRRKRSKLTTIFCEEKTKEKEDENEVVQPQSQLSWGRLASAIYRKTSVRTEVSIASTVPGEFEEEEVEQEREQERMNSIPSLKSDKSDAAMEKPIVNRFLSSISLATTKGPSSTTSVVYDSMEEEEPNKGIEPMIIDDNSQPFEFEIMDTVEEGAPKEVKVTKQSGLGLFRRPIIADVPSQYRTFSPPPPSRHSSGGSTTSANPRGKRQIGMTYEDKLSNQLETALALKSSDSRLLKYDNSSVASRVLTVEEDRSSGWGIAMVAHSRGHIVLPTNTAPPEGSCVRVALPLSCVLDSVAIAPIVL